MAVSLGLMMVIVYRMRQRYGTIAIALTKAGVVKTLFNRLDAHLKTNGYLAMGGQIVDATIVQAPRQRMSNEEKEIVKRGDIPDEWKRRPRKLAQKDRDAGWVVKFSRAKANPQNPNARRVNIAIPTFGCKDHILIDRGYGFVREWEVTNASRHDGYELEN